MRDLRKAEDDYGSFMREEGPPSPPRQLTALLRDGPPLGMHTLIWCDTVNNVQRSLDRQALRELSLRVAFQMSVSDSSTLLESPLAAKLGMHRALFVSEDAVKKHLQRLSRKFGVEDAGRSRRTLLANEALRRGGVSLGDLG